MEIMMNLKKTSMGVAKKYNDFMYKGDTLERKNKILAEKNAKIESAIEAREAERAEKKLTKKAKADRDYSFFKAIADEKGIDVPDASEMVVKKKPSLLSKIASNLMKEEYDFEELEEGYGYFFGADTKEYVCKMVDANQLFDEKYAQMKAPSGQSLLSRDLEKSKLFISDDDDMLKVTRVIEVKPELPSDSKAYVLLQTSREDFVVEFTLTRSF